jgi:NitT/TauT family transport system substrate-binding protein
MEETMTNTSNLSSRFRCRFQGLALGAVLVLSALASAHADSIRVGESQPTFSFMPLAIGMQEGFFKKLGLDINLTVFSGSSQLHQAIAAGSIDIGLGAGPEFGFLVKGSPEKAVAAMADAPGDLALVVLKNGPIKTVADLKGKRVSMSTRGSLTEWAADELSEQQGWGPNGMVLVPLGSFSAQTAALETHQVDAMSVEATTAARLSTQGIGLTLVHFDKVVPVFHIHLIFASNALIKSNPNDVKAFLAGWFQSLHYMETHRAASIQIASETLDLTNAVAGSLYDYLLPFYNQTGKFNPKALDVIAQSMVDMGTFDQKPDLKPYYTEQYLPASP